MQRMMPHTGMTIHKNNACHGNNGSRPYVPQVHVCNGQRRWFHGTAGCVAACAHKAPRSQTRITSTMTERRYSRAKSKRRLGTTSGTELMWLAPPEVDLTYPAWYLRSWLLYRPLAFKYRRTTSFLTSLQFSTQNTVCLLSSWVLV